MVEVVETTTALGTNAVVIGGKKQVRIRAVGPAIYPAYWTNPIVSSRRGSWLVPQRYVPAGWYVEYDGRCTFTTDYERAIDIAIYHAKRK